MVNRNVGTKQSKEYIKKLIVEEARRQGVPEYLALAVAAQESGFNNVAVSKKNTDGSRDHGVFQLNDRYHKLKDVYNPIENIRYGIGMLKAGLKKNKGNIAKTLSDYNAGANAKGKAREQGNAYAQKVMNLFPSYGGDVVNKIAQSSPQPTAQINKQGDLIGDTSTLKGESGMTGAASPINPDDAILQGYLAPEALSGYKTSELVNQVASPTSAQGMIDKLRREYAVASRDLTPTEKQILNRKASLDPNTIIKAEKQRQEAVLQAQKNQGSQNQGMLDMINKAYADYMSKLQNDYRLQNTGYQLTPEEMQRTLQLQRDAAVIGDGFNPITPAQEKMFQYQTQIANQYGVPYEQYMAAMADIQAKQQAARLQQIQDYITFAKNNGATDQEIIKQLGNTEGIKQLVANADIQAKYSQAVAAPYMTQAGQLRGDYIKGINDILTANQQNVTDITKQQMANQAQLSGDILRAQTQKYGYDTTAGTALRGQDVDAAIAEMQQGAKDVNAAASMYEAMSNALGYTPEQRAGMINALPAQQRSIVVNPAIAPAQLPQIINPNNQAGGNINTQNPYSFQNLMNRFNANRTLQQ